MALALSISPEQVNSRVTKFDTVASSFRPATRNKHAENEDKKM